MRRFCDRAPCGLAGPLGAAVRYSRNTPHPPPLPPGPGAAGREAGRPPSVLHPPPLLCANTPFATRDGPQLPLVRGQRTEMKKKMEHKATYVICNGACALGVFAQKGGNQREKYSMNPRTSLKYVNIPTLNSSQEIGWHCWHCWHSRVFVYIFWGISCMLLLFESSCSRGETKILYFKKKARPSTNARGRARSIKNK